MSTQPLPAEYIELRCRADKSLMARIKQIPSGEIEIKCRRCKKKFKFTFPTYQQQLIKAIATEERESQEMQPW